MKTYGGPAGPDAEVDNGLVLISVVLFPVRENRADLSSVLHPRDHLQEKDPCKWIITSRAVLGGGFVNW